MAKDIMDKKIADSKNQDSKNSLQDKWYKTYIEPMGVTTPFTIVNFWASWCSPCVEEMPSLSSFHMGKRDTVTVVAINNDQDSSKKMDKVMKEAEKKYPSFKHVLDLKGEQLELLNYSKLPTTLVFKNGHLIFATSTRTDFNSNEFKELFR
jgi:thiol-disulfide isomerase/thioredoxin